MTAPQKPKKVTNLRVPPHSTDAEKALLGSIMLRPDAINEVIDIVSADSYYGEKHRRIYEAMMELFGKSEPIDLLSVSNLLTERKLLEQTGGMTYLTELANAVPSSANIAHYGKIVQAKYMMRELISASEFIAQLGYDESQDLDELLDKAEKKIFDLTSMPSTQNFTALSTALGEAWERFDNLSKSDGALRGVPCGFADIDSKLAGFQPSDLIILAARPSTGKTAFALDIARKAAVDHGVPVGFFSLEMSDQQLVDRMLASDAQIDSWGLRTGKLKSDAEFESLRHSLDRLSKAPIYIDDQPGNNILTMRSVARRLKAEKGLGMIIVDYLQLMMLPGGARTESMTQQVTEISRSLKNLARELDVPVIALSQLSRAVEQRGGKPRLSDLRDSGSIEQDADVVMFLHKQQDDIEGDPNKPKITEVLIEKHRNGPTGRAPLIFKSEWVTFQSVDKHHGDVDFEDF